MIQIVAWIAKKYVQLTGATTQQEKMYKAKLLICKYTRSLDSAPSISAILRLVLIEQLAKCSFSALLQLNKDSFPSD